MDRWEEEHGVSFEEARSVFCDERAIRYCDPGRSEDEDRFIMLGMGLILRVPVVCHCYRENDSVIRIVSARRGSRNPYIKPLKRPIRIRLDRPTVAYFKALASELGVPYQNLIDLYLRDCVLKKRKLEPSWVEGRP
jgi:uncharacterized protein